MSSAPARAKWNASYQQLEILCILILHYTVFYPWKADTEGSSNKKRFLDAQASLAPTPVSWLVTCSLCWCLWTVTERQQTMGRYIFSESYDQHLSDFDFQSVFLRRVPGNTHLLSFVSLLNNTMYWRRWLFGCHKATLAQGLSAKGTKRKVNIKVGSNLLVIIKSILRIDMYIHNCVPTNWTKGWPDMFVKHYGETLDVYFFKMEYGIFAPCMAK